MWKRCLSWALGLGLVACGPEASWEQAPREEWTILEQRATRTVGPLLSARYQHCSTVLPDGTVMFAGGGLGTQDTATTEVYDPTTGTVSPGAPMNTARRFPSCLLLQDGTWLVLGGANFPDNPFAERYQPTTRSWVRLPPQPQSLSGYGMAMTSLDDGRVLIVGGVGAKKGSYLFDPIASTWTTTGPLNLGRMSPALVKLPDGRVLAIGGSDDGGGAGASLEVYSPSSGSWSPLAPLLQSSTRPSAVLSDGRVFVIDEYHPHSIPRGQMYDLATDTWFLLPGSTDSNGASGSRMVRLNGQPVVVSGSNARGSPQTILRFDAAQWRWNTVGQLSTTSRGAFSLDVLPGGSLLVAGGIDVTTRAVSATLDLFVPEASPPPDTAPLSYSVTQTDSARRNTVNRFVTLNAGDILEVGTCNLPGASSSGDTYLRLFNAGLQVASNDEYCGSASFIRYTAPTTGTYELRAGCYANIGCGGTVSFRVIPSPMAPMTYQAAKTHHAQHNTFNRSLLLNAGDLLEVGTCGLPGASATGDTFLSLFGAGTQVDFNDDACGGSASFIQYQVPTTGTYELRAGCFADVSCSGTVVFRITPAPTLPLSYAASYTHGAQQNTINRFFTLKAGDLLEVGTCGLPGASATGDTSLRVFGASAQVAFNDDACFGTASYLLFTAPTPGVYEVRAGCHADVSCGGTVVFRITPAEP